MHTERRTFWIIGGGGFGLRAAEALRAALPPAEILLVEKDPRRCRELAAEGFRVECADGIVFLGGGLAGPRQRLRVVAAAPLHVAYEWVCARLAGSLRVVPLTVPGGILRLLPNPHPGARGQVFASNAAFTCPPDCPEAGRTCTATGRPRPRVMHRFLRELPAPGVKKLVVRSVQLAPGVGGLRPVDLFAALDAVRAAASPVMLATACKCHAVVNLFKTVSAS